MPHPGLFLKGARKQGFAQPEQHWGFVVVHVTAMALNFLHSSGRPAPALCLSRPPSDAQLAVFDRLLRLTKASARLMGDSLHAGRKGLNLAARHAELTSFLSEAGLCNSGYGAPVAPASEAVLVPHLAGGPEELTPYRDLDPDRIVIHGTGSWDLAKHLGPNLLLPYLEPAVLTSFVPSPAPGPSFAYESKSKVLGLLKKWDSLGLLGLVAGPLPHDRLSRVFGAFKSEGVDRQIGDRGHQNNREAYIVGGPSARLPAGNLLVRLSCPLGCALYGSCVDRKDFYHQALVSQQRCASNAVGPVFDLRDLYDTKACTDFIAQADLAARMHSGPGCSFRPSSVLASAGLPVHGAFRSLYQGDHAGVEYAAEAHENLLRLHGVLGDPEGGRLLNRSPVAVRGPWSGLIIDDLFSVSCERPAAVSELRGGVSESEAIVRRAKAAYDTEGVRGSDLKDVFSQRTFTVAGAQVDASEASCADGLALVGLPAGRRAALAYASLVVASGRHVTEELASLLTGCWVHALLFRRCLMAVIGPLFRLGKKAPTPGASLLRPLPPDARLDLVMLACLSPLMVSNVSAKVSSVVGCSDASLGRGAVCTTEVPDVLAAHLWQATDSRGWYTRLDSEAASILASIGEEPSIGPSPDVQTPRPERPPACHFDFIEVRCGGPWLTGILEPSCVTGPVVDYTASPFFNLADDRCLEWILFMLQRRRLRSLLVMPPVGSFSPKFRPPLRSWSRPRGTVPSDRTKRENLMVGGALSILRVARLVGAFAVLLHPAVSFARALPCWQAAAELPGVCSLDFCSCDAFAVGGSAVTLLALGRAELFGLPELSRRTALSAASLAAVFLERLGNVYDERLPRAGLENLAMNDVLLSSTWSVRASWAWRSSSHINVKETRSFLHALRQRGKQHPGEDLRFTHALDSAVSIGALTKGRTSSLRLLPSVRQSAALQVGLGMYPGLIFAPTRLNPSDDPTRDSAIRLPVPSSILAAAAPGDLFALCCLGGLSRASSGWLRLALLLVSARGGCLGTLARSLTLRFRDTPPSCEHALPSPGPRLPQKAFDSTLGYPGEGPSLVPRNKGDLGRAKARQGIILAQGRPVLARTSENRDGLLRSFDAWLREKGTGIEELLAARPLVAETIAGWLVAYGRELFEAGRPYWHYSETINAIGSRQPVLRRQLQGAWDLAFGWMAAEPYTHHVAMPPIILLAMVTTCLLWGWAREAGIFSLCWGGLLRIGESLAARRGDLILPRDVLFSQSFALLRVQEPKTRLRAARHQSAKIQYTDLVDVLELTFGHLEKQVKLWPQSGQTLRRRFDLVLERLGVTKHQKEGRKQHRPLDLGSFRPGGATHLLQLTEDSELVRRRGRWVTGKIMEIYIQEVSANTFFPSLDNHVQQTILTLAQAFPGVLEQTRRWKQQGVPTTSWYPLFTLAG